MPAKERMRDCQFDLSGGHVALDFVNSVSGRDARSKRKDHLHNYSDLISFALQSRLITAAEAEALQREAHADPVRATQIFRSGIVLREALYRSLARAAAGKAASPQDLEVMEKFALAALRHRHISRFQDRYLWRWEDRTDLERILWRIAQSAVELIVSDDLAKVRECEASDCAWLFFDTSRNHSRRWCDMSVCGNREKARRHHQRQHADQP